MVLLSRTNPMVRQDKNIHRENVLRILSKNVQSHDPSAWRSLLDHDILLLQEVSARTIDIPGWQSSGTGRARVLVNTLRMVATPNILLPHLLDVTSDYVASMHVKTAMGELLVVCVYGPSGNYKRQFQVLASLRHALSKVHSQKLQLVIGGDFNCVQNDFLDVRANEALNVGRPMLPYEDSTRDTLEEILVLWNLTDVMRVLFPDVQHGTNKSLGRSRRLDRIYIPAELEKQIYLYDERLEEHIASTHCTVCTTLVVDLDCRIEVGKPRFCISNKVLSNPTAMGRILEDLPCDWDTLVGLLKKRILKERHLPVHEPQKYLGKKPPLALNKVALNKALVFKLPTQKIIFSEMSLGDVTARDTEGILGVATQFWGALFARPPEVTNGYLGVATRLWGSLFPEVTNGYLLRWPKRTTKHLDHPFTANELYSCLRGCTNGSPGEDGLTYQFWSQSWHILGDRLTAVANALMQGVIPQRMTKVLISLIPKKEKSTQAQDFRPIALINTSLRIICLAINNRLLGIADELIGDYQTGFLQRRHIDDNIAQFRSLVEMWRYGAIRVQGMAMIDFQKAFDSVSHMYIKDELKHVGISPGLRTAIMTVIQSQCGQININNTFGEAFPMDVGLMQGNPFSPFLFILAIEPLLYSLNRRLKGAQITHQCEFIGAFKLSAFADDLMVFLDGDDDHVLKEELDAFCSASNTKVNAKKSLYYCSNAPEKDATHPVLHFPMLDYKDDVHYLGFKTSLDWNQHIHKLLGVIHGMKLMSPTKRAYGINTFVVSKLYYRDLHTPMSANQIERIKDGIVKMFLEIGVRREKVFALVEHGGFGVVDIEWQLLGRRAQYINNVIYSDQWQYRLLRAKIQFMLWDKVLTMSEKMSAKTQPMWHDFLAGACWRHHGQWLCHCNAPLNNYMTLAEAAYVRAWFLLFFSDNHKHTKSAEKHAVDASCDKLAPCTSFPLDTQGAFSSVSRARKLRHEKMCMSRTVQLWAKEGVNLRRFWRKMKLQISRNQPYDYIHMFHLGGDVITTRGATTCRLCLRGGGLRHTYYHCRLTRIVWRACGFRKRPTDLVGRVSPSLDRFFYLMRRLLKGRVHADHEGPLERLTPYKITMLIDKYNREYCRKY